MIRIVGCNPMPDGTCRTLKEQYHKTSVANFLYTNDWGATGYIYIYMKHHKHYLRVPQATAKGYIECPLRAVFDWGYSKSTLRRGRVQGG